MPLFFILKYEYIFAINAHKITLIYHTFSEKTVSSHFMGEFWRSERNKLQDNMKNVEQFPVVVRGF